MEKTFEIWKKDGRLKSGDRLIKKIDFNSEGSDQRMKNMRDNLTQDYPLHKGYRIEERDTFVTKNNMMSGEEYRERYDTPISCSPASGTFWSM